MPSMFGGLPEPLEASRTLGEVSFAKRVNQHNWTGFKRLWGHPRWFSTESYSSGLCFCRLDSVLFEITLYMPFLPNCLRYFTAGSVVSLPPKAWLLFTFCRVHFAPNTALTALIFSEKKRDSQAKYLSTSNITCTLYLSVWGLNLSVTRHGLLSLLNVIHSCLWPKVQNKHIWFD